MHSWFVLDQAIMNEILVNRFGERITFVGPLVSINGGSFHVAWIAGFP